MNTAYKQLPDETRVWIYQSNRAFQPSEAKAIKWEGSKFIQNWMAHGQPLNAAFEVFHNQFLVFFVDESQTNASGCSIDESVNFIKAIEKKHQISLMDRNVVAFKAGEGIATCTLEQFTAKIQKGVVSDKTLVFNNTVSTKKDLATKWEVPVRESWLSHLIVK